MRTYNRSPMTARSPFIQVKKRKAHRERWLARGWPLQRRETEEWGCPCWLFISTWRGCFSSQPSKGLWLLVSPVPSCSAQGGPPQPSRSPEPWALAGHKGHSYSPNFSQQGDTSFPAPPLKDTKSFLLVLLDDCGLSSNTGRFPLALQGHVQRQQS